MSFRFADPFWLILLALIPVAVYFRTRRRTRPAMVLPGLASVRDLPRSLALTGRGVLPVLRYGALVLMILALARPQWGTRQEEIISEGVNIVLAIDLSESMAALDFRREGRMVNRLEAVRGVVRDFVEGRSGDRIGMVVFGTHAYTQLPLTRDYTTIASILDRLEIGAAGERTAIGDAIGIAVKRLADVESESNVIILLTDGQSNAGALAPDTAAVIAAEKEIKIYTIGVGSRGKAPIPVRDPILGERFVYQKVDIDEETLRKIASRTGGLYFRAEDTDGLARIYETIDEMETTEAEVKIYAEYNELYPMLLLPALGLLAVWTVLTHTRFLRIP